MKGAAVALVGRRRDRGEGVASSIRAGGGGKAIYMQADVADARSVEEMSRVCLESLR